jgi:streptomycin 6-kinase
VLGRVTPGCRQRLTAHYGSAVAGWLEHVPVRIQDAAECWELCLHGYHDAGHASALAVARDQAGEPVIVKAWFDHDRYRNEVAALRHWEAVNGRVVIAQDDELAVAMLAMVGAKPGGAPQPAGADHRVAEALARLHSLPIAGIGFPTLERYLRSTVEPRVRQRLCRFGSEFPDPSLGISVHTRPVPTSAAPVLLHTDLYQENVPFTTDERPVFLDPLPMLGDPGFDWAFFVVYFDLGHDPLTRLHLAHQAGGIEVRSLVSWCVPLCLDGLLYYHEVGDEREPLMREILATLIAEGRKP